MREILSKTELEREDILSRDFEQEVFPMGCLKWCNEKIITPKVTFKFNRKGSFYTQKKETFCGFARVFSFVCRINRLAV